MFHLQRRQQLTPAATAANAARRAAREAAAMTCQCCGSHILANTGVVAHHGYQRPGDGWQTASCFGARRLPFEVDRAALGELIEALKNNLAAARATLKRIKDEAQPIVREYTVYGAAKDSNGKRLVFTIKWTRGEFDDQRMSNIELLRRNGFYTPTFDDLKKAEITWQEHKVKDIVDDVKHCQRRYDGWKATHDKNSHKIFKEWRKLS